MPLCNNSSHCLFVFEQATNFFTLCLESWSLILSGSLDISSSESKWLSASSSQSISFFQASWNWSYVRNKEQECICRLYNLCIKVIPETQNTQFKVVWNKWLCLSLTCLARFRASSSDRPLSTDLCTTFSHRDWTLTNKFLIRTTSCFWLRNFNWFPVWSNSMIWSRWAFTSLAKTWENGGKNNSALFKLKVTWRSIPSDQSFQKEGNTKTSSLPCAPLSGKGQCSGSGWAEKQYLNSALLESASW